MKLPFGEWLLFFFCVLFSFLEIKVFASCVGNEDFVLVFIFWHASRAMLYVFLTYPKHFHFLSQVRFLCWMMVGK